MENGGESRTPELTVGNVNDGGNRPIKYGQGVLIGVRNGEDPYVGECPVLY